MNTYEHFEHLMSQRHEPPLTSLSAGLRQAEHLFESLSALSFDEGLKSAFEGGVKRMMISPSFQDADFRYPLSKEDKITRFADIFLGWKLQLLVAL